VLSSGKSELGRLFLTEDDLYGAARTVTLNHGLWQEKFGGDATVISMKLMLDGEPYEVIGVLPPGFEYFRTDDVLCPSIYSRLSAQVTLRQWGFAD